jgi:hypothetical protein
MQTKIINKLQYEDSYFPAKTNSQSLLQNWLLTRKRNSPTSDSTVSPTDNSLKPSMENVMKRIDDIKEKYKSHPLFRFLADTTIDPMQRLSFVPQIAFFIMAFGDLNKFIFRYNNDQVSEKDKKRQEVINKHTLEDDHHFLLFLEDVEKLGFNKPKKSFGSFLSFLWSEETQASRRLTYDLAQLSYAATDPLLRFIMIEAIEATGNVLFHHTVKVTEELVPKFGELRYFGKYHLLLETGHLVANGDDKCGCDHAEEDEVFGNTDFDPSGSFFQKALVMVDSVFEIFENWNDEMLAYAKAHPHTADLSETSK